jgi:histone acetyltransferase (RNA polymerase elongator complex component)
MGCPNQCVFCNQHSISGCHTFRESDVAEQIETALSTIPAGVDTEIAFFGGSFTGIDRELMIRLLDTAEGYVRAGRVTSIRLSTRPDYISDEILEILSHYSVKTVELGLQSMDDEVLSATRRGHTAKQAEEACRAVVDAGFELVGQMMIGLPRQTAESECETARKICELGASAARIYPTVVFYGTPLADMVQVGHYQPISVDEAVLRAASVLEIFAARGVPCIRIGLCATEELSSPAHVLAGPNHVALGELVWNEYYYRVLVRALAREGLGGKDIVLHLPEREISKIVGQHRKNIVRLQDETDTRVRKIVTEKNTDRIRAEEWCGNGRVGGKQPCI